ncbi:MAG TPA: UvrD-helicase domain-containing protein [Coriobacteriaceae bacterium]|nr:UvrD-helicase domain-containing protein [Coriobacteriaceae bacterium]
MDKTFEAEQEHLSTTYAKLQSIERSLQEQLASIFSEVASEKDLITDELNFDFDADIHVETMAELEAVNRIIDTYNIAADVTTERLHRAQLLLKQPYFAKVTLQFKPGSEPKDVYIGNVGMTDDDYRHFIVDWRSPIAEVYYNQDNGKTSYEANGRTIDCELKLRRQFDIERDQLKALFDTTVAIQDEMLLAALAQNRSSHLSAITATIQKEQNEVIRHEDVPALLVSGIAGSGKTSVLLQRIAYLFYRQRDTLKPEDVFLITPNPVFQRYIENVLPEMGESNPSSITFESLMCGLGLGSRDLGREVSADALRAIDEKLPDFKLKQGDFTDIRIEGEPVITAAQAHGAWSKLKNLPTGSHRSALVIDDLLDRLEQRIKRLAKSEKYQDMISDMSDAEQIECFGENVYTGDMDEAELVSYTERFLRWRYAGVEHEIAEGRWLRLDAIGMRLTGSENLSAIEWLYLKLALVGGGMRHARYVMIDEVQDYSAAQLMCLARYFGKAHFMMLGDENQAIREGTASFDEIREVFTRACGSVDNCELMTSYRSSPEITALFTSLLDNEERVRVESVQPAGIEPVIIECADDLDYEVQLKTAVEEALEARCLAAIIAPDARRLAKLEQLLEDLPIVTGAGKETMPEHGVLLLDIKLAKGLEFDQVIVPDAGNRSYPDETLARHRLYTAISRATKKVTLVANGKLTSLLR